MATSGFLAATISPGDNRSWLTDGFFSSFYTDEMRMTMLIHELLHQAGAGDAIDGAGRLPNENQIAGACGTAVPKATAGTADE